MLETLRSVMRFRRWQLDPVERRLSRCANVDDLRSAARRRLPRGVFDYIDGGAESERTLARNREAFDRVEFRPRVLRGVGPADPTTSLLGRPLPLPLVLAPTGFCRMADPHEGELAVARAAGAAGVPFALSTLSTRSIEDVASASGGPRWFQVYAWRDRGLVKEMVQRAAEAGYEALLLTVDTAVLGRRERDVRAGFTLPPRLGLGTLLDGLLHPGWTWDLLRSDPIVFANVAGRSVGDGSDPVSLADYINTQFDPSLGWSDVEWLRQVFDGPVVVKGIQTVEDAALAADAGLPAVVLSNHGGRQLDHAPPPLELVAAVKDRVGDRLELVCDGGVLRGSDVVKAVALGARACMVGRAYLYALGAGGERGVARMLAWFDESVRRTLTLLGCQHIDDLGPDHVRWRER